MYIGNILLQPQKINRATVDDQITALIEDILSLFIHVAVDKSQGGQILDVMEDAMVATAIRLRDNMADGLDKAQDRLKDTLKPFTDAIQLIQASLKDSDPAEAAEGSFAMMTQIANLLKNLSPDELRVPITELVDIIEKDLGLNSEFLELQIWALIDDLVARLKQAKAESNRLLKENRLATAATLRRVKRHLRGLITLPQLNADDLSNSLIGLLGGPGVQKTTQQISCVGTGLSDVFQAGTSLTKLVPYTGFGARSLGAGEAPSSSDQTFPWYPNWLLGTKDQPSKINIPLQFMRIVMVPPPEDKLWMNTSTNTISRENIIRDDMPWPKPGLNWDEIPEQDGDPGSYHYTFGHADADLMESFAKNTSWIADYLEMLLDIYTALDGSWLAGLLYGVLNATHGTYKLARKRPLPNSIMIPWRAASYTAASFQSLHWGASAKTWVGFWLSNLGYRALQYNTNDLLVGGLRDFFMAFCTLLNYQGPREVPDDKDDRPENRKEIGGVVSPIVTVATNFILIKSIPRTLYGIQAFGQGIFYAYWLGGGTATALLAGTAGTVVAESIAWAEDFKVWGKQLLKSLIQTLLFFPISFYTTKENDTDGGKYNPQDTTSSNLFEFKGYPDPADSPYLLPYEKGKAILCVQGNQGLWSHNNFGGLPQVYAYDLALNAEDEILASRHGTVVDYFDWVPNDTDAGKVPAAATKATSDAAASGFLVSGQTASPGAGWNFIVIRHDLSLDDHGNLVAAGSDPKHDLGAGGGKITTYAVYGHGRTNGVRDAFNTRGIAPNKIIGQKVKQGQFIMKAGSTGNSFHNHVHMHVQPGPSPATAPPITSLTNMTIPFVFKDAKNLKIAVHDGIPQSFTYYGSDNVKQS